MVASRSLCLVAAAAGAARTTPQDAGASCSSAAHAASDASAGNAQLQNTVRLQRHQNDFHATAAGSPTSFASIGGRSGSRTALLRTATEKVHSGAARMRATWDGSMKEIDGMIKGIVEHDSESEDSCSMQLVEYKKKLTKVHESTLVISVEVGTTSSQVSIFEKECHEKDDELKQIEVVHSKRVKKCTTERRVEKKTLETLQHDMRDMRTMSKAHIHLKTSTGKPRLHLLQEKSSAPKRRSLKQVRSMVQKTKDTAKKVKTCLAKAHLAKAHPAKVFNESLALESESPLIHHQCDEFSKPRCYPVSCGADGWVCGETASCPLAMPRCHPISCVAGHWQCGTDSDPAYVACQDKSRGDSCQFAVPNSVGKTPGFCVVTQVAPFTLGLMTEDAKTRIGGKTADDEEDDADDEDVANDDEDIDGRAKDIVAKDVLMHKDDEDIDGELMLMKGEEDAGDPYGLLSAKTKIGSTDANDEEDDADDDKHEAKDDDKAEAQDEDDAGNNDEDDDDEDADDDKSEEKDEDDAGDDDEDADDEDADDNDEDSEDNDGDKEEEEDDDSEEPVEVLMQEAAQPSPVSPVPHPETALKCVAAGTPTECQEVVVELEHQFTESYVSLTRMIEEYEVVTHSTVCEETVEEEYTHESSAVQDEANKVCREVQGSMSKLEMYKMEYQSTVKTEHKIETTIKSLTKQCGSLTSTEEYLGSVTTTLEALGDCPGIGEVTFQLPTWVGDWAKFRQNRDKSNKWNDNAMFEACVEKFGHGVRVAEVAEIDGHSIQGMPDTNSAEFPVLGACPDCRGRTMPGMSKTGRGRICWDTGSAFTRDDRRRDCAGGPKAVLCVFDARAN